MTRSKSVVVVGGGLVGLATAHALLSAFPGLHLTVLEKEDVVLAHQSGHNSGVLHTGIYYVPGSLKALNCARGKQLLQEFCVLHSVPFELCGKLIVATSQEEIPQLEKIVARGQANNVRCQLIGPEQIKEIEPAAKGVRAIHVPDAGIVDYPKVGEALAKVITQSGGSVRTRAALMAAHRENREWILETSQGTERADLVVNCAGLHCDLVARMMGASPQVRIIPFRGEYYMLTPEATHLCRALLYPVPDPDYPFLGVHFTRMIRGGVECGPNAVLAFAREGYNHRAINLRELTLALSYPGFWRFASKHWRTALSEFRRSLSSRLFAKSLQKLVPEVTERAIVPAGAGVRAQAMQPSGKLVDDFLIQEGPGAVHVLNAPSPAATSCLSIGDTIAEHVVRQLELK